MQFNTLKYINALQQIVDGLNQTPHIGLGGGKIVPSITPQTVHKLKDTNKIIKQFHRMYNKQRERSNRSFNDQLQAGSFVRFVSGNRRGTFRRGFYPKNTEEIFEITSVD